MKRLYPAFAIPVLLLSACSRPSASKGPLQPKAYGSQIVEVSGGKQITGVGSDLPQPIVVQVNGPDGKAVPGALVSFHGDGVRFNPEQTLSDSSGQATTAVQLGFAPGDYQIVAETPKSGGGSTTLQLRQTALGYQATLGKEVSDKHCVRCHDPESTTERVSNFENLSPQPHAFTDGAYLNTISETDLIKVITLGGPALNKSPAHPAFGATLTPAQIKAAVAYMRAVADPPYQLSGAKQ
jgi:mono/diheme cytochrome c family protein